MYFKLEIYEIPRQFLNFHLGKVFSVWTCRKPNRGDRELTTVKFENLKNWFSEQNSWPCELNFGLIWGFGTELLPNFKALNNFF